MVANQTESARLEQRSVIKFLVADKCKPYRRMCNVYRKVHLEETWIGIISFTRELNILKINVLNMLSANILFILRMNMTYLAQSSGAIEYTDCFSAEE